MGWRDWPPGNPFDKYGNLVDPGALAEWERVIAARPDLAPATQSPVRVLAHGVAGGLGESRSDLSRAMKIHILGDGVVPQQAAAALVLLADELGVTL